MKELQKLMDDISEWSDKTFGDKQRNPAILYHLKKEVPELIEAIEKYQENKSSIKHDELTINVFMEFADCFMLLLDSADKFGIKADGLMLYTREKLAINKSRNWGKPDKNGVVEHIK